MTNAWGNSFDIAPTCGPTACGTGTWTGPKPGDPDTANVVLSARTVFGGIQVSWTYPAVYPEAVAHTLLYRSTSGDFATAVEISVVAGNTYMDAVTNTAAGAVAIRYYYWIKIVSVNGTVGNLIGPASAILRPTGDQTLEGLTGLIHDGVLATALREDIAKITLNYNELMTEISNRLAGNAALSAALAAVQSGLTESLGLINTETTTRMNGQDALAQQLTTIAAVNSSNAAAIFTEQTARVSADEAMATDITELYAATSDAAAAVVTEAQARTTADTALAGQMTTVQATLGDEIASVQTNLQVGIGLVDNLNTKVTGIGALYTAKVAVNGLVGGFGVYNDGTEIEAGFEVDRFWVGRTANDKVLPFVIDNGIVYINKARVNSLSIEGRAATSLDSDNGSNTASVWVNLGGVSGETYDVLLMATAQQPQAGYFIFYDNGMEILRGIGTGLSSMTKKITGAANSTHNYSMQADFGIQCTLNVFVSKR